MKKLFHVVLFSVFVFCFFLFPMKCYASGEVLKINGTAIDPGNYSDIQGNGYLSYDASTHTLSVTEGVSLYSIECDCTQKFTINSNVALYSDDIAPFISVGGPLEINTREYGEIIVAPGVPGDMRISCHGDLVITTSASANLFMLDNGGTLYISAGGGNVSITSSQPYESLSTDGKIVFSEVKNVYVSASEDTSLFNSSVEINATGDVTFINSHSDGRIVSGSYSFAVTGRNVELQATNPNYDILGNTTINATDSYHIINKAENGYILYTGRKLNGQTYGNTVRELSFTAPKPNLYYTPLLEIIEAETSFLPAKETGEEKVIEYSVGDALPNAVMRALRKAGNLSLLFSFSYEGINHTVLIPGDEAEENDIPWYGPLYLLGKYGEYDPDKATNGEYTVLPGDSLNKIAKKFGKTLADILKKNPTIKNPNLIHPGDVIRY